MPVCRGYTNARRSDFYGGFPGNAAQQADANQACVQAEMKGDKRKISLPCEAALDAITWTRFRDPVFPMLLAVCGHPDSTTWLDDKMNESVAKSGFQSLGAEWPSTVARAELKLLLTVYVDDFKLAGPSGNLSRGWDLLKKRLDIGEATSTRLGCDQKEQTFLIDGTAIARDMEAFLEHRAKRYQELSGGVAMKTAHAPRVSAEGPKGKTRDPAKSRVTLREWCDCADADDPELAIPKEEPSRIEEEPG
jgi:hypothetical protein